MTTVGVQVLAKIDYGERLTDLRQSHHWSRERLACAINVSYNTIRRLEMSRTTLTPDRAEAIALAYGLQLIEFWEWMCDSDDSDENVPTGNI